MDIPLKPYKKDFEHSYTFGFFPTLELLTNKPEQAVTILVSSQATQGEGIEKIKAVCASHGIPLEQNDKAIDRLSPKENSYVIGVFKKFEDNLKTGTNHLVLVNPSNMGNLGTILRTAVGFGVDQLAVIRPGTDAFDPKTIRASMGAVFRSGIEYFEAFDDYRKTHPSQAIYPFMLDGAIPLREAVAKKPDGPYSLVFGNESSGLPPEFQHYGTSVVIPHESTVDSLNLTIAVGIALYAFVQGK